MNRCFEFRHCVPFTHRPQWRGATEVLSGELIVYVASGSLDAQLDGTHYHLPQGSTCWIPHGTHRHLSVNDSTTTTRDWRLRFTLLGTDTARPWVCRPTQPLVKQRGIDLLPYLQQLNTLSNAPHEQWRDEASTLIESLCIRFSHLPDPSATAVQTLNAHQLQQLNERMEKHIFTSLSPRDLAETLRLSHDYFTRIFKHTYGVPPRRYLRDEKMRRAGDILMETNLSLKELCSAINEPDQGTFCRQFKKVHGCTPTQYRARQRTPMANNTKM